jgi:hypothetical protein
MDKVFRVQQTVTVVQEAEVVAGSVREALQIAGKDGDWLAKELFVPKSTRYKVLPTSCEDISCERPDGITGWQVISWGANKGKRICLNCVKWSPWASSYTARTTMAPLTHLR